MKHFLLSAVFLVSACAHKKEEKAPEVPKAVVERPEVSIETKQMAVESGSTYSAEIVFPAGSSAVGSSSRAQIDKVRREAAKSGKIESARVIAWADAEYPSKKRDELSEAQVKLADERAERVEEYLKSKGVKSVEKYNMAERPDGIEKWLQSSESRLKESLELGGIPTTDKKAETTAKKSRAMVIFLLEESD